MRSPAQILDSFFADFVSVYAEAVEAGAVDPESEPELACPVTLGEVIEMLVILHVRNWHLEDLVGDALDAEDMDRWQALKLKLEHIYKVQRPRLMESLNALLMTTLAGNTAYVKSPNVKEYKGYGSGDDDIHGQDTG